jgi:hypothetical protein
MTKEELIAILVEEGCGSERQLRSFLTFCSERGNSSPLQVIEELGKVRYERRSILASGGFPLRGTAAHELYA